MSTRKHKPIHPGEVLKHDFLKPLGLTAYRVAKETGITAQHVGRIIHGQRGIGADMALRLAQYLGTSPELWMNLQSKFDLDVAADRAGREIEKHIKPHEADVEAA